MDYEQARHEQTGRSKPRETPGDVFDSHGADPKELGHHSGYNKRPQTGEIGLVPPRIDAHAPQATCSPSNLNPDYHETAR